MKIILPHRLPILVINEKNSVTFSFFSVSKRDSSYKSKPPPSSTEEAFLRGARSVSDGKLWFTLSIYSLLLRSRL